MKTYRVTMDVVRVNKSFNLKVGLILQSEANGKFPATKVVDRFSFNGNHYVKINPNPFVILDISNMKASDGWNTNQSVSLSKKYLFMFIQSLSQLIQNFRNNANLFYYRENELVVNIELAEKLQITVPTSNKTIRMQACVVLDEETNLQYEGSIFYINTMDNFSYLTFTEMEYLLYELVHLNLPTLSVEMIMLARDYIRSSPERSIDVPPQLEEIQVERSNVVTRIQSGGSMPKI